MATTTNTTAAPKVPLSGHHVAFPVKQDEVIEVKWTSGKQSHSAPYYACRCWWVSLKDPTASKPSTTNSFQALGETVIFIAAELLDEKFSTGTKESLSLFPLLSKYHILDRADYLDKNENWALLPLDSSFQYGQDRVKRPRFHFLVYHPPIYSNGQFRTMFQHRFIENSTIKIATALAAAAAESGNDYLGPLGTVATPMISVLRNVVGHYLHTFLDQQTVADSLGHNVLKSGSDAKHRAANIQAVLTSTTHFTQLLAKEAEKEKADEERALADGKKQAAILAAQMKEAVLETRAAQAFTDLVGNLDLSFGDEDDESITPPPKLPAVQSSATKPASRTSKTSKATINSRIDQMVDFARSVQLNGEMETEDVDEEAFAQTPMSFATQSAPNPVLVGLKNTAQQPPSIGLPHKPGNTYPFGTQGVHGAGPSHTDPSLSMVRASVR